MNNKILYLILGIFLISFTSAIYAGETIVVEHNLGTDKLVWTIIENTSELTVLPEVTINSTHISVYFPTNIPPSSFTMVFLEETTNEVIKEIQVSSGGGGHSHTITKIVNNTIEVPIIKEIPINVTEYKENKTTETIETNKIPYWLWIIVGICGLALVILLIWNIYLRLEKPNIKDLPKLDSIELKGGEEDGRNNE